MLMAFYAFLTEGGQIVSNIRQFRIQVTVKLFRWEMYSRPLLPVRRDHSETCTHEFGHDSWQSFQLPLFQTVWVWKL